MEGGRDGGEEAQRREFIRNCHFDSYSLHSIPMLPGCRRRYES